MAHRKLEFIFGSLDQPIPNPAMHLPCENITKEANIISKTTGL
jgi:hypothetical protein